MIKTILLGAGLLLAVAGICELIHSFRLAFIVPKGRCYNFSLVTLKRDRAVRQLRFALEQRKWLGSSYGEMVIATYEDIGENELDICNSIARKNDVVICPSDYIKDVILSVSKDF